MDCMRTHFEAGVLLGGRFETISPLNHGSFGMVFMAKDTFTGQPVAVKCLTKPSAANNCSSPFAIDDRSEELAIHSRIGSHPNIVNLIQFFETDDHAYLVLEFCPNGDLYEAICLGRGPLETEHVRDFMLQLVDAVDFLHAKGLYHRDIKPENIFLTQSGSMKLGDFGLATTEDWSYETAVGSDRYMAPEQFDHDGNGYSPAAADIWAIGICLLNILFSRNPFACPARSDPLFADFRDDRQSLFDVFPNMSQDTFEVLVHCLAIDPSKRSLGAVKEAIHRVVSFTTDDESLDEFCTEERNVVPATVNREPLRTPSVSNPSLDKSGSFPWAKALQMSLQKPVRQLSAIADDESYSEDLFPSSERSSSDWFMVKPGSSSLYSTLDSGLGMSFKSLAIQDQEEHSGSSMPRAVPVASSLPASTARLVPAMSSVFGKNDIVSKSWSDLWDEDEDCDSFAMEREDTLKPRNERAWSIVQQGSDGRRSTTPRAGLAEMKNSSSVNNSRNRSPAAFRDLGQSNAPTDIHLDDNRPTNVPYSPPSKRSIMEKWAALGNRRRTQDLERSGTPLKRSADKAVWPVTPSSVKKQTSRERPGNWRRNTIFGCFQHGNDSGVCDRKVQVQDWSSNGNWRDHQDSSPKQQSGKKGAKKQNVGDDIADLEWVGGWHDLHS
ncbi:kinase-like domain-containing protein [Cryomyces antarcticus]